MHAIFTLVFAVSWSLLVCFSHSVIKMPFSAEPGNRDRDCTTTTSETKKVAVIGSGLIGQQWAMLFAAAGFQVKLYDITPEIVSNALADIGRQLAALEESGHLRGSLSVDQQKSLIQPARSIAEAVSGALYVQENVPERLEMKLAVSAQIDAAIDCVATVVGSSTSSLVPSKFTQTLKNRERFLVAHPVNPPYYVRLVELVPAPWTLPEIVQRARQLMLLVGQAPVSLSQEVDGFSLNRLQYAVINEAWNQVEQGILSPEDVDTVMKEGLGPRYAFMGPFETCHLNAEGFISYCERYEDIILSVSKTLAPPAPWKPDSETAKKVYAAMLKKIPVERLRERMLWRNRRLAALAALKDAGRKQDQGTWASDAAVNEPAEQQVAVKQSGALKKLV